MDMQKVKDSRESSISSCAAKSEEQLPLAMVHTSAPQHRKSTYFFRFTLDLLGCLFLTYLSVGSDNNKYFGLLLVTYTVQCIFFRVWWLLYGCLLKCLFNISARY